MCKEKLEAIALWLEADAPEVKGVEGFDMRVWTSNGMSPAMRKVLDVNVCGTTCCIAGTAVSWEDGVFDQADGFNTPFRAQEILGLTDYQAHELFYADNFNGGRGDITKARAARTIRHLIATGEVDWSV